MYLLQASGRDGGNRVKSRKMEEGVALSCREQDIDTIGDLQTEPFLFLSVVLWMDD